MITIMMIMMIMMSHAISISYNPLPLPIDFFLPFDPRLLVGLNPENPHTDTDTDTHLLICCKKK